MYQGCANSRSRFGFSLRPLHELESESEWQEEYIRSKKCFALQSISIMSHKQNKVPMNPSAPAIVLVSLVPKDFLQVYWGLSAARIGLRQGNQPGQAVHHRTHTPASLTLTPAGKTTKICYSLAPSTRRRKVWNTLCTGLQSSAGQTCTHQWLSNSNLTTFRVSNQLWLGLWEELKYPEETQSYCRHMGILILSMKCNVWSSSLFALCTLIDYMIFFFHRIFFH